MSLLAPIGLHDFISAVDREIEMRRRVYPRWVKDGRMKQEKADYEIAVMTELAAYLRRQAAQPQR